jgi:hypothetical protein
MWVAMIAIASYAHAAQLKESGQAGQWFDIGSGG